MNPEHAETSAPPPITTAPPSGPSIDLYHPIDLGYLVRRFFECNPFYLASAALLLFGLYRLSIEPGLFRHEVLQLVFNLSSLQVYAVALVVTAVFLARRLLWYDTNLLLTLENVLLLVPFILISQASLINSRLVWLLCVSAAALAIGRFWWFRRGIFPLNVPANLAISGTVVLLVNAALPIAYRLLHESKVGTKPDWGAAYHLNAYAWCAGLPCLIALLNTARVERGRPQPVTNSGWLPLAWMSLWIGGTIAHLYSLGYVYDFELSRVWLAPACLALGWTLWLRANDWWPGMQRSTRDALLLGPSAATFMALTPGIPNAVHGLLLGVNICAYGLLAITRRAGRLGVHLAVINCVMLAWVIPAETGEGIVRGFSHGKALGLALAIYGLGWGITSRNPKAGVMGAVIASILTGCLAPANHDLIHWAIHVGLGFLLVHSLRWVDASHPGACATRNLASTLWVAHGVGWVWLSGPGWPAALVPALVIAGYVAARLLNSKWLSMVVALASLLILIAAPARWVAANASEVPIGLAAIGASFVLFGVGTVAALTRQHWHR